MSFWNNPSFDMNIVYIPMHNPEEIQKFLKEKPQGNRNNIPDPISIDIITNNIMEEVD